MVRWMKFGYTVIHTYEGLFWRKNSICNHSIVTKKSEPKYALSFTVVFNTNYFIFIKICIFKIYLRLVEVVMLKLLFLLVIFYLLYVTKSLYVYVYTKFLYGCVVWVVNLSIILDWKSCHLIVLCFCSPIGSGWWLFSQLPS